MGPLGGMEGGTVESFWATGPGEEVSELHPVKLRIPRVEIVNRTGSQVVRMSHLGEKSPRRNAESRSVFAFIMSNLAKNSKPPVEFCPLESHLPDLVPPSSDFLPTLIPFSSDSLPTPQSPSQNTTSPILYGILLFLPLPPASFPTARTANFATVL